MGQKVFEIFWREEEELCIANWARWDARLKGLAELERRWQHTSQEVQMLNKRQEILKNAIEGKLNVQDRANERLQDRAKRGNGAFLSWTWMAKAAVSR